MSRHVSPGRSGPLFTQDDILHLAVSFLTGIATMALMHARLPHVPSDMLTLLGGWIAQLPFCYFFVCPPIQDEPILRNPFL